MSRLNVGNLYNENEDGAPVVSGISTFSSPYYFVPPSGSTAQRPSSPGEGMIRFNTDSGHLEYYTGTHWADVIVNNNELGGGTGSNTGTGTRGLFAGGYASSPLGVNNTIDYITISTLGNAQDFGDLTNRRTEPAGASSRTRSVVMGGGVAPSNAAGNTIDFVTIASTGDATDFGDLLSNLRGAGSTGNRTRGICVGGITPGDSNVIQYVTIASTGNAVDFGDNSVIMNYAQAGQVGSSVRGIFGGAYTAGNSPNFKININFVTIASTGNAQEFGDLTLARGSLGAVGNSTRAVFCGGYASPAIKSNILDFITIATTGNAQDFGDLISGSSFVRGSCSSPTRGVTAGGYAPGISNRMESIEILSTGNSVDFGDMVNAGTNGAGCSNGHGGL